MLVVARDLGRLPSELLTVGSAGYGIVLKPDGGGGFVGELTDRRPPVLWAEVLEMLSLYLLEKEEEKEAREAQE